MNRYNISVTVFIVIITLCLVILIKIHMPMKAMPQQQDIDYSWYMNKTWVTENDLGEIGEWHRAFNITKIENGVIEGEYGSVPRRNLNYEESYGDFSGNLNADTAVCQFIDRPNEFRRGPDGRSNVTLRFRNDGNILMSVDSLEEWSDYYDYLYCPYNVSDISYAFIPEKNETFPIDLDYGEDVSIIAMYMLPDATISFPYEYLINEKGDILFFFDVPSEISTELTAVAAEDLNGDGLKDIILTETSRDGKRQKDWQIYQTESGGFSLE